MARAQSRRKRRDGVGYKFLIVSLLIIMFVIFLIGLQIGRIVEKTSREGGGSKVVTRTFDEEDIGQKIRSDIEQMRDKEYDGRRISKETVSSGTPASQEKMVKKPDEPKHGRVTKIPDTGVQKSVPAKVEQKRDMLFLQVGVFSIGNNAENMKVRLEKYGLKVRIETHKTEKGEFLRKVLVGPYFSAEEVTKEREKIRRLTGTKPVLVKREG